MKVLILANNDVGMYHFRYELIEELSKNNEIVLSLPYGELVEPFQKLGCTFIDTPIDRRGINPFKDIRLYRTYKRILNKVKPDFVITYTIKPNIYGGFACKRSGIPYAVNITGLGTAFENGGLLMKIVTFMNSAALSDAKVVFFENEGNRQIFIQNKIVKEDQTCRLNGAGVNLEKYQVNAYPAGDVTRFLFMGRVMAEKGINELFDAMKSLVSDGQKVELDILGGYEEDYKCTIERYEAEGWLHYHGFQKDVKPFIRECNCFVLPSWHEGMANTILESAASGRPIITSNIYGCREAVVNGISGFLCERKNATSLYEAMKKFCQLPYNEKVQMGLEGRKHMVENFNKTRIVIETIERLKLGGLQ